jgi:hypothetical protein
VLFTPSSDPRDASPAGVIRQPAPRACRNEFPTSRCWKFSNRCSGFSKKMPAIDIADVVTPPTA